MMDGNGRPHATDRLFMLKNVDLSVFKNFAWDGTTKVNRHTGRIRVAQFSEYREPSDVPAQRE